MNTDTKQDVLISEPYATVTSLNVGRVFIYKDVTLTALHSIVPATTDINSLFGLAVANAGDVNADGRPDIMIGHPYLTTGGNALAQRGRILIYSGLAASAATSTILQTIEGTSYRGLLGRAVAGVGDINNDGISDVIFSEPQAAAGGIYRGRAFIWLSP